MGIEAGTAALARRAALGVLLAAGLAPVLAGCGSDPEPPPPKTLAEVNVMAAPTLNPDINGRPSPVVVRFHQLVTTDLFNNADFFQLFEQDQAALGPTSVGKQDAVVQPGQIETIKVAIKSDVTALGVVVAFRNFEKAVWRAVVPVEQDKINALQLQILSQNVQMSVERTYRPEKVERTAMRCRPVAGPCLTASLPSGDGRS